MRIEVVYNYPSSAAELQVGLSNWYNLSGEYVLTTCFLVPAIAEYHVVFHSNGSVILGEGPDQGRVVSLANNTRAISTKPTALHDLQHSTMDSITVDTSLIVASNATVDLIHGQPYFSGDPTSIFTPFVVEHWNYSEKGYDLSWYDPTADVISTMNKFMFRAGVVATGWDNLTSLLDPGVIKNQTVPGVQEITQNIYKSDLSWWAGAAILQLATALFILPMFWGWWRLECSLTLSPFATALAFDSPILQTVNSASRPREIVDKIGATRLKYGVVTGTRTDGVDESNTAYASGRLGLAESSWVEAPGKGLKFSR